MAGLILLPAMNEFIKPIRVQALADFRRVLFRSDGTKGEVDLSDLAGKGVFQVWNDYHFFEGVHLGAQREIKWNDEIELSADSLYLKVTGKSPEELFPKLRRETFRLPQDRKSVV